MTRDEIIELRERNEMDLLMLNSLGLGFMTDREKRLIRDNKVLLDQIEKQRNGDCE